MSVNSIFLARIKFNWFTFSPVCLAFGMKESSLVNNLCTAVNMGIVVFVVIAGAMNGKILFIFYPSRQFLVLQLN